MTTPSDHKAIWSSVTLLADLGEKKVPTSVFICFSVLPFGFRQALGALFLPAEQCAALVRHKLLD